MYFLKIIIKKTVPFKKKYVVSLMIEKLKIFF